MAVRGIGRGGLLDKHLVRLRALPAHGNRTLHLDQLFLGNLILPKPTWRAPVPHRG